MSEIPYQPIYAKCGMCQRHARMTIALDHHPALNRKVGVCCDQCSKHSIYTFSATPEAEMGCQQRAEQAYRAQAVQTPDPEEWQDFHMGVMLGLMPQPAEPEPYTPDDATLFRWRLMRHEGLGPLDDHAEEDHACR